jgi:Zn finger protein HypA/HybF involved in hydrogenase expression
MTVEFKVPRLFWENLESVLYAQSLRYISELAHRLNVPEKELQRQVLPSSDKLVVTMLDSQAECNQCKAYIQLDKMTVFCKKPVAYHSDYCLFHRNKRMHVIEGTQPAIIQRIKDRHTMESLWLHENTVFNSNGAVVGKINKEKQVFTRYMIMDEVPKPS